MDINFFSSSFFLPHKISFPVVKRNQEFKAEKFPSINVPRFQLSCPDSPQPRPDVSTVKAWLSDSPEGLD